MAGTQHTWAQQCGRLDSEARRACARRARFSKTSESHPRPRHHRAFSSRSSRPIGCGHLALCRGPCLLLPSLDCPCAWLNLHRQRKPRKWYLQHGQYPHCVLHPQSVCAAGAPKAFVRIMSIGTKAFRAPAAPSDHTTVLLTQSIPWAKYAFPLLRAAHPFNPPWKSPSSNFFSPHAPKIGRGQAAGPGSLSPESGPLELRRAPAAPVLATGDC